MITPEEIIKLFDLKPLVREGGYFSETYRSAEKIPVHCLPQRYAGERAHSTAIYYLLTADSLSLMHRIRTDEIFHFYLGDCVEMLQLFRDGCGRIVRLGTDIAGGESPQVVVPADVWQGARIACGGSFALLGTTVAPAFDADDYEQGGREKLVRDYPEFKNIIEELTKK